MKIPKSVWADGGTIWRELRQQQCRKTHLREPSLRILHLHSEASRAFLTHFRDSVKPRSRSFSPSLSVLSKSHMQLHYISEIESRGHRKSSVIPLAGDLGPPGPGSCATGYLFGSPRPSGSGPPLCINSVLSARKTRADTRIQEPIASKLGFIVAVPLRLWGGRDTSASSADR